MIQVEKQELRPKNEGNSMRISKSIRKGNIRIMGIQKETRGRKNTQFI